MPRSKRGSCGEPVVRAVQRLGVQEPGAGVIHLLLADRQAGGVLIASGGDSIVLAVVVALGRLVAEEAPRLGQAPGRRAGGRRCVHSLPGWRRRGPMRRLQTGDGNESDGRSACGLQSCKVAAVKARVHAPAPPCPRPACPSSRRRPGRASAAAGSPGSRSRFLRGGEHRAGAGSESGD